MSRTVWAVLAVALASVASLAPAEPVSAMESPSLKLCVIEGTMIGTDGLGAPTPMTLSADGSTIAFYRSNFWVIRAVDGTAESLLGTPGVGSDRVALSRDGLTVAFVVNLSGGGTVVEESVNGVFAFAELTGGFSGPSLSGDGNLVVTSTGFSIRDRAADTVTQFGFPASSGIFYRQAAISDDGSTVAYIQVIPSVGGQSLYVYDVASGTATLISGIDELEFAESVTMSHDGRFLAFQSGVSASGTQNPVTVYDRDVDGNGIFDETDATETTTVAATESPQTRDGQVLDQWKVVDSAISGDGTVLTTLIDTGDASAGSTAIEQIDIETGAVMSTSFTPGSIAGTERTQLRSNTDGSRTVFVSLEDLETTDTNSEPDIYLFAPATDCQKGPLAAGVELEGDYQVILASDYDATEPYGLDGQQYCAANVSGQPPFDIVCWGDEANRDAFTEAVQTAGPRPPDEAIWFSETDPETGFLPAPVKP